MLYELHLKPPAASAPTPAAVIEALATSGTTWHPVASADSADLCLLCHDLEIALTDDMLILSVPVSYTGQAARDAFDLLWSAVRCLQAVVPSPLFDPQLGHIISVDSPFDVEKVLLAYAGLVRHLQSFDF